MVRGYVRQLSIYPNHDFIYLVDGKDWVEKLVPGKKYHINARFTDDDMIFVKMGIVGVPEYPVFSKNGGTQMLPWREIDRIEPVEEKALWRGLF